MYIIIVNISIYKMKNEKTVVENIQAKTGKKKKKKTAKKPVEYSVT